MMAELQSQGEAAPAGKIEYLRELYGLDQPLWQQYFVLGLGPAARRPRLFVRV